MQGQVLDARLYSLKILDRNAELLRERFLGQRRSSALFRDAPTNPVDDSIRIQCSHRATVGPARSDKHLPPSRSSQTARLGRFAVRLLAGSVLVHSQLRILVLDEHAPSMSVLRHALRSRGYTCKGATTIAEALELAVALQPDVVLYEWHLRDDAGRGLANRLRAASNHSVRLMVAVSTLDEPEGFCASECVDAYLTKPFHIEQVEALLAR